MATEELTAELPERLRLREVKGPTAVGGGAHRFVELLKLIAVFDFKKTYFGTVLGYAWSLARPLMLFGVLLAVFTQIFRLGSQVPNYPVLLLFNIVVFSFFSESTNMAVPSIVGQEGIVRKTQFPRLVIPLAVVATTLMNMLLNLIVVVAFMLAWGIWPMWTWLLFPFVLLALVVFTCAVSMILASLYPRFRDTLILWSVASTALFYGTPVLYPINAVPKAMREIISLNPLAPIMELGRKWVIDPTAPGPVAAAGSWTRLLIPAGIYLVVCLYAVWLFRREAPRIAEQL